VTSRAPREPCINGGTAHAPEPLGLDVNDRDELVTVRRCVWCKAEQEKPYGGRSWRRWQPARQDASARPDRTPDGPHPVPPGTPRQAADVALTDAPGDPNPPHPSPAWCRVCRQRGYASAHCAAVAARAHHHLTLRLKERTPDG
jgi:hypothetical protein